MLEIFDESQTIYAFKRCAYIKNECTLFLHKYYITINKSFVTDDQSVHFFSI